MGDCLISLISQLKKFVKRSMYLNAGTLTLNRCFGAIVATLIAITLHITSFFSLVSRCRPPIEAHENEMIAGLLWSDPVLHGKLHYITNTVFYQFEMLLGLKEDVYETEYFLY